MQIKTRKQDHIKQSRALSHPDRTTQYTMRQMFSAVHAPTPLCPVSVVCPQCAIGAAMAPKVSRRLSSPNAAATPQPPKKSRRLTGNALSSALPPPNKQNRRLGAQSWPRDPSIRGAITAPFGSRPSLEAQAKTMPAARAGADLELAELSDGTTSDAAQQVQRSRTLLRVRRGRYRVRKYVDAVMDAGGQSFLEKNTVEPKSQFRYDSSLRTFLAYTEANSLPLTTSLDWDEALVTFMNRRFFEGHQAYIGEVLICAVMDKLPEFSKGGNRSLPRAWKCVKGWRRLTPGRSRRAWPMAFWAGMATRLVQRGQLVQAVLLLVAVSSYARPSELLALRKDDLHPPARGISKTWSLRLRAEELLKPSKVGSFDDTISLDSPELRWLEPVLIELKKGNGDDPLFNTDYPEYVKAFKRAVSDLGAPADKVVPYCTRHSGASIDRARKT